MDKNDIFKKLLELELNKDKYIILSGASMVVQGVKSYTQDIDLSTCKSYFDVIKWEKTKTDIGTIIKYNDVFEIGYDFYYKQDIIKINGFSFMKLEKVLEIKKKYLREKDKEDILKLEKYLKYE